MNTQAAVLQESIPHTINDQLINANLTCAMEDAVNESKKDSTDGEFHTLLKQVLKLAPKLREHAESIKTAESNYEEAKQMAVDAGSAMDGAWSSFETWFAKHADKLVALRGHFPKPGSHKTISIEVVAGALEDLTWGGFVERHLGISLSYLNRLIKDSGLADDDATAKRSEAAKKANETKKRNAQARRAGENTATETVVDVAPEAHFDDKDPYWGFSQIKSEPETLANEIAGMLMEFGFDLQQITSVLNLAMKIAKSDLKKN